VGRAQGWYGYWLTPDDVATSLVGLRAAADRVERPAGLGALEISVTPRGRITPDRAAAYAVVGEDRLVVLPPPTPDGRPRRSTPRPQQWPTFEVWRGRWGAASNVPLSLDFKST
jgi:hypothetical protein